MKTVNATELKNRLGQVLAWAEFEPVAVERHGRVVAHLVPVPREPKKAPRQASQPHGLPRAVEERLVALAASRDFRPSRWLRAGDPRLLAGVATMLASQPEFDRAQLLALAERLWPGMTHPAAFGQWLDEGHLAASRFLPQVRSERRHAGHAA